MSDNRLPVPTGPGWTCFFCGDTFVSQKEAEDHFGFRDYEDSEDHNPACVQRLNFSEKELREQLMDTMRELDREREAGHELESEIDGLRQQLRARPRVNQVVQLVVVALSIPGIYLQNLPAGHPWVLYGYLLLLAAQPIWIVETLRHRMWGMFAMAWLYTGAWSMGLFNHW